MERPQLPSGLDVAPDVLSVSPERMRELGYWVVDRVIEHITTLETQPALRTGDAARLREMLDDGLPQGGHDVVEDLRLLSDVALGNQQHGDHPRYFARVPGPSSYPAVLGEWLATGMQSIASSWAGGSGPTTLELTVLDWLRDALGLDAACEGVMVSGGSMANATALIAARNELGPGVAFISDQTHSSIARALRSIGFPAQHIVKVPTDDAFRMDLDALRAAVSRCVADGEHPLLVVGSAGTTNTGAVDDLQGIADLCMEHAMWFHIDGAYGGSSALHASGRAAMPGLERADSFVVDPHKWLFQPYDVGCVWVRRTGALERAFAMYPEYLADLRGHDVDLHNRGLELSRRARAVKVWLTLRAYGTDTLAAAISRGIALAEHAQSVIEAGDVFRIVTPAQLGIVTFVKADADAAAHARVAAALTADGYAAVSTTVLAGTTVLRLCTINPRTTTADIEGTLARLAALL